MHERDRGVEPAALAARELAQRAPTEQLVEAERGPDLVDRTGAGLGAPQAREPGEEAQVVAHRERRVHARLLGREADQLPGPLRGADDVDAAHVAPPRVGPAEPGDDRDQRGLARAVRAEQAEDLAGADRQVDARSAGVAPYALRSPSTCSIGRGPGSGPGSGPVRGYPRSGVPPRIRHTGEYPHTGEYL